MSNDEQPHRLPTIFSPGEPSRDSILLDIRTQLEVRALRDANADAQRNDILRELSEIKSNQSKMQNQISINNEFRKDVQFAMKVGRWIWWAFAGITLVLLSQISNIITLYKGPKP